MNSSYLGTVWTEVQRAETLLFQSAVRTHIEDYQAIIKSLNFPPESLNIMIRLISGFNSQSTRAEDYLQRYPFSDLEAVTAKLETCVEHELMSRKSDSVYVATEKAYRSVKNWMESTGKILSQHPLEGTLADDAKTLVAFDYRVVSHTARVASSQEYPILRNRLQGLYPDYDPLHLWHHWQLVWTMIAAREDSSWRIYRDKSMAPLTTFFHRQLWFRDRRPWLARGRLHTLEDLNAWAERYSPLPGGVTDCAEAIEELTARGWIDPGAKHFQLNDAGLSSGDAAENAIDADFLRLWPELAQEELEAWHLAAQRLNAYFVGILENLQ